jgi:Asp-tRNA(Asn)/Glu-tRNA(Gln) amidotransferase A subunit family amidase
MAQSPGVSRRQFIVTASVAAAAGVAGCKGGGPSTAPATSSAELIELSAVDAVAALAKGDVTAERYATALLAQCERCKALNAFTTLEPERVLASARAADQRRNANAKLGPLHGLPIPIKDSINTKDYPTTGGTPALRNFRPKQDAAIVQKLTEAGAIVLGKTNLHELSFGWTSNNLAFGAVHNPYDVKRIPGGSSGGTGVAVAARMAPIGVAEDTEGSIRVPAAMCGVAGFRPTTTRYPSTGVVPISALFDQVGPHARSVGDLALFDSVVTGDWSPLRAMELKGVKLGVGRKYWYSGLDAEVERITSEALRKLVDAGAELVEAEVPELARLIALTTNPIQNHDVLYTLKKYLADNQASVSFEQVVAQASADIKRDFARDVQPGGKGFVSPADYRLACNAYLPKLRQNFREFFARTGVTAIVFPVTMVPPTPIGEDAEVIIAGKKISFETAVSRNIAPGSTAGLPGLVLPAGLTSEGLPIAMEFDGPAGSDRALLALGLSAERVLGRLPAPKV